MGIAGHILGEKKLRRLQRETGIPFDRAYNRNGQGEGRVVVDGYCEGHYWIDFHDYSVLSNVPGEHWFSCPRR